MESAVDMNKLLVAKTLRNAADEIGGESSVKEVLDGLLARTGKTEEILAALADLYAEKAKTEEYADMTSQMNQTEELLRAASQAVAEVWEP